MLEKLLKQMGFDPIELKKQVDNAAKNFSDVVEHFDTRLDGITATQTEILKLLQKEKSNDPEKPE